MIDKAKEILSQFKKPDTDPDFYAAKQKLRKIPGVQMAELIGKKCTLVSKEETTRFSY